jgi:hypothetical protein
MQGEPSTRLGFTDHLRVELAWATLLGAVLSLAPVPARLKEWACAAFAITLGSALIAQFAAEKSVVSERLALYQERQVKPRRADDRTRIILAGLSRFLEWRQLLVIVTPEMLIRWHRNGFRLLWRRTSRAPGRPTIAVEMQRPIATMEASNRTWGEERIANELLVKLGSRVSPRTVRRYMPSRPPRPTPGRQGWTTFVRNHAQWVLASDFFVVVTATFRIMYVFVVLEVRTQRNSALERDGASDRGLDRATISDDVEGDQAHRFVFDDRDTIYSEGVDRTLEAMGLSDKRMPSANA